MRDRRPLIALLFFLAGNSFAPPATQIVIIGMGIVSPIGPDVPTFVQSLRTSATGMGNPNVIPSTPGNERFQFAAQVPLTNRQIVSELTACQYVMMALARNSHTDRQSLFALRAAAEAIRDAGIIVPDGTSGNWTLRPARNRVAVNIGSTLGGPIMQMEPGSRLLMGHMFRAPTHVVMGLGLEGEATCSTAACASGIHALVASTRTLRAGDADIVLAGASDAQISERGLFSRAALLSPTGVSRPFDANADGIVLGEGASVVAMSTAEYARQNGYSSRASIAGYSMRTSARDLTGLAGTTPRSFLNVLLESGILFTK